MDLQHARSLGDNIWSSLNSTWPEYENSYSDIASKFWCKWGMREGNLSYITL